MARPESWLARTPEIHEYLEAVSEQQHLGWRDVAAMFHVTRRSASRIIAELARPQQKEEGANEGRPNLVAKKTLLSYLGPHQGPDFAGQATGKGSVRPASRRRK